MNSLLSNGGTINLQSVHWDSWT